MQDTAPIPNVQNSRRPSIPLVLGSAVLMLISARLGFKHAYGETLNTAYAVGYALSSLTFPFIVAGLFSFGKKFRNPASLTKIVFWTSVVLFLTKIEELVRPSGVVG